MTHDETSQPQGLPEAEHHRYGRILLAVTVTGVLFLGGQAMRWWQEHQRSAHLQQALHEVYHRALAAEPGRMPYGRLQFELGKMRALSAQRLDMVELLAALSRRAPEGIRIRTVSMASTSGTISGVAATPEEFKRYQVALDAEASFTFSVKRLDALPLPLGFELSVKARDRAAPPRGDDQ